jgi:hypothetical protein
LAISSFENYYYRHNEFLILTAAAMSCSLQCADPTITNMTSAVTAKVQEKTQPFSHVIVVVTSSATKAVKNYSIVQINRSFNSIPVSGTSLSRRRPTYSTECFKPHSSNRQSGNDNFLMDSSLNVRMHTQMYKENTANIIELQDSM